MELHVQKVNVIVYYILIIYVVITAAFLYNPQNYGENGRLTMYTPVHVCRMEELTHVQGLIQKNEWGGG